MVLRAKQLLSDLSFYHYLFVAIGMIVPAVGGYLLSKADKLENVWVWAILIGWSVFALLLFAFVLEQDRSKADRAVNRKIERLFDELQHQKETSLSRHSGLQDEISEIYRVMQLAFAELGYALPPRRHSIRANFSGAPGTISASLSVVSSNKLWRIWGTLNRAAIRSSRLVRHLVWGTAPRKPE